MRSVRFVEGPEGRWQRVVRPRSTLMLRAFGSALDATALAIHLEGSLRDGRPDSSALATALAAIDGRFVLVLYGADWIAAAVDRIRSAPLLVAETPTHITVGMHAPSVLVAAGLRQHDPDGSLAAACGGFTIGGSTLYRDLTQLRPGEWILATGRGGIQRGFHWRWEPWREDDPDPDTLGTRLRDVTIKVLERTRAFAGNREIVVPLSAGYDSRVIVAGLKVLGATNVRCFAYGPVGSSEVETSRAIAARLGYAWRHVVVTPARMRRHFASETFSRFLDFADAACATPFVQDVFVLDELLAEGWLGSDAVMVNGQSGDFITGNHVPDSLNTLPEDTGSAEAATQLFGALRRKHFSLWRALDVPENTARIDALLARQLREPDTPAPSARNVPALYEHLELIDRQSKYVIAGQRGYEFHCLDWSLPLWDDPYLEFWARVPRAARAMQTLYASTLRETDWGAVWKDIPVNRKRVRPMWVAAARSVAKPVFALAPRRWWRRFEKNILEYWTDTVANYAIRPYRDIVVDNRGHRNAVAWITEAYLARHGISWTGKPFGERELAA